LAAFILLFVNFCLGIGLKSKYVDPLIGRWRVFDLHQFTAILGGALVVLHVGSLLGDSYFNFSLSELFIPMASPYRPFWTALGVIGLYGGAVLALSSYIRKLIGQKVWRALHYVSFILFFMILVHGIKSGTDVSAVWVQYLYISTGTVAAFLVLWRIILYQFREVPRPNKIRTTNREESLRRIKEFLTNR
jgi:sulfoxide reductase heme-binding subunit YedZ